MRPIDADEMVLIESEAYMEAQLKVGELTRKVNEVVHMKLLRLIADTPTIDAVEVVRCKDCKYGEHYKCSVDACYNNMKCVRRENYTEGVFEDDYCSYGERKPPEDKP